MDENNFNYDSFLNYRKCSTNPILVRSAKDPLFKEIRCLEKVWNANLTMRPLACAVSRDVPNWYQSCVEHPDKSLKPISQPTLTPMSRARPCSGRNRSTGSTASPADQYVTSIKKIATLKKLTYLSSSISKILFLNNQMIAKNFNLFRINFKLIKR